MTLIAEKTGSPALNELETRVARRELAQVLEQHQLWLDSNGTEGERADLTGARLDRCYLAGAKLRRAILDSANLKNSDLMLADLREASLIGASLQGANLLGTQFRDADLQSARFADAMGMVESQFAGANLHGAEIPLPVAQFSGIQTARQLSATALWFFCRSDGVLRARGNPNCDHGGCSTGAERSDDSRSRIQVRASAGAILFAGSDRAGGAVYRVSSVRAAIVAVCGGVAGCFSRRITVGPVLAADGLRRGAAAREPAVA